MVGDGVGAPRTIGASEFKVKCLELMDQVAETGGEIVIIKDGRPISRLVPYRETPNLPFGRHKDKIGFTDDMVTPMPAEWFQGLNSADKELF